MQNDAEKSKYILNIFPIMQIRSTIDIFYFCKDDPHYYFYCVNYETVLSVLTGTYT